MCPLGPAGAGLGTPIQGYTDSWEVSRDPLPSAFCLGSGSTGYSVDSSMKEHLRRENTRAKGALGRGGSFFPISVFGLWPQSCVERGAWSVLPVGRARARQPWSEDEHQQPAQQPPEEAAPSSSISQSRGTRKAHYSLTPTKGLAPPPARAFTRLITTLCRASSVSR